MLSINKLQAQRQLQHTLTEPKQLIEVSIAKQLLISRLNRPLSR